MAQKNLSRSERESRRAMLKLMVAGGATLAVLGGGMWAMVALSDPPSLEGASTLQARLADGGLDTKAFRLRGTGAPDVVIVGSSDCVHCQKFVAEGLDGFLEQAARLNLVVDYVGLATGPGSIVSSQALACLEGARDPAAAVRATYTLSGEVTGGLEASAVADRLASLGRDLGVSVDGACWTGASPEEAAARSRQIVETLMLQGTPSFYVATQADPTVVRVFSGYAGAEGVRNQLRTARES